VENVWIKAGRKSKKERVGTGITSFLSEEKHEERHEEKARQILAPSMFE
jgi:hypothetical protein